MGAKQIATDAANAIRRAQPGMEVRQGDIMAPEPLDQLVTTVIRSAEALADYADTGEFVSQLTEIAHRWETRGRPSPAEWRSDYRVGRAIEDEMMSRVTLGRRIPPSPE
jgi:hypothetical protein